MMRIQARSSDMITPLVTKEQLHASSLRCKAPGPRVHDLHRATSDLRGNPSGSYDDKLAYLLTNLMKVD
jgi:hypothetical protein